MNEEEKGLIDFRELAIEKLETCKSSEDVVRLYKIMLSGFSFMEALGFESSYGESRRPIVEELTDIYLEKFRKKEKGE